MKFQKKDDTKMMRNYKYGIVPTAQFPKEGIQSLYESSQLWGKLIDINLKHKTIIENLRQNACAEYALISQSIELKQGEINQAYKEKSKARCVAQTRDKNHPLIKDANDGINKLIKEKKVLLEKIKTYRKEVDKKNWVQRCKRPTKN